MSTWSEASGAIAIAALLMIVPGMAVLSATFRWSPRAFLLAPAVSASVLATSALVAPVVHLRWSLVPVAVFTIVAAGGGYALRRGPWRQAGDSFLAVRWWPALAGAGAAAVLLGRRLMAVFIGPDHISQTFDNVAHLNAIRWAMDHGSASPFDIAAITGSPFYPNGWNSLASLVAQLGHVTVPVAASATNIVVGALVWPVSCMALAAVLFRGSSAAILVSGLLSTGFAAFPMLLFDFGVLYPNAFGYALLPATLAVIVDGLRLAEPDRSQSRAEVWRSVVLLLVLWAGLGLAHPNAFLSSIALSALLLIPWAVQRTHRASDPRRAGVRYRITVYVAIGAFLALWLLARTPIELSRWPRWQSTLGALHDGLLANPGGRQYTWALSALFVIGLVVSFTRKRGWLVLLPMAMALFLFVLAAGVPLGNYLREAAVNPWNNDPFRLAALLPTAAIPVATAGVLAIGDGVAWALRRVKAPAFVGVVLAVVGVAALGAATQGPNVQDEESRARAMYVVDAASPLLSQDEWQLLGRLPQDTPKDALIAGNPRTGTSLAYAFADRHVLEPHIFTSESPDAQLLDRSLRHIDTDPQICQAVTRLGVTYVLDFGRRDVHDQQDTYTAYDGIQQLTPTAHLVLVDSQGDQARLFRIQGC